MPIRTAPLPLLGIITLAVVGATRASYAGAIAAAASAVFLTAIVPPLAERSTFLLALGVIVVCAWKSGWRVGGAAAITSFALIALLMPPAGGWLSRTGQDALRFATFVGLTGMLLTFARAREIAEARLRRTEALAQVVVDNGPVLIAGADADGNTVMFNRACEQLTGYTRQEVIGKPFVQTFVPESWQGRVLARFRDEPIERLALPHENPWVTKASTERVIEWRCFRVMQDDGAPITVGVGQDVTERHQAQLLVNEGVAREAAAREALAATNAQKEQFIALLAHELRTPLNAAMGWFHILRTGKPEGAAERAEEAIDRNLQMMHALIEDVVDFNRAEFGKLTLNRTAVDIGELLGEVTTSTRSIADSREIRVRTNVLESLPHVQADPKRLRQVIVNVISNALKFTPPGGEVTVAARPCPLGVEISVADNGSGIETEDLARIFDPHSQAQRGERADGLGLGLALVKRLVEAHGGEVRIASDGRGLGTEVVVALPAHGAVGANVAV